MIADLHDTFQTPGRLTRLRWRLHLARRCNARLADTRFITGPCIGPRGHDQYRSEQWHADGTGYIWDHHHRWRWMGPPVGVEDLIQPPETP